MFNNPSPAATTDPIPTGWQYAVVLLIIVVVALIYGQTYTFDFINFDDEPYVVLNEFVNQGFSKENIYWAFTTSHLANWHPMTWFSHQLDSELYGLEAGGHHVTNVIFHGINSILVFKLMHWLGVRFWPAAIMALLFAVHPTHVESVAWVAERKDVLSTFFLLTTLMAYQRYVSSQRIGYYLLSFLLLALGLASKSMLVTVPCLMLLLDYHPFNRLLSQPKKVLLEKLPFFALVIAVMILTFNNQEDFGAMGLTNELTLQQRLFNALVAYEKYTIKAVAPAGFSVLYPHPGDWPTQQVLLSLAFLTVISLACLWQIKKRPYLFVGWAWFVGTLVPVIGIVQVGNQYMADRYTYVPYIGLFYALVLLLAEFAHRISQVLVRAGVTLLLAGYGTLATIYTSQWENSIKLYSYSLLTVDPYIEDFWLAAAAIGWENTEAMDDLISKHAKSSVGGMAVIHYNLANALAAKGRFIEASHHYMLSMVMAPDKPASYNNLGLCWAALGEKEKALEMFHLSTQIDPDYKQAQINLDWLSGAWNLKVMTLEEFENRSAK